MTTLKRTVYEEMKRWAKGDSKKCALLKGARQVGKTFIARQLGKNEFDSFIEINFLSQPEMKNIFSGNLDIKTLLLNFSVYMPQARFIEGRTLILLDEIQECPEAITSLKFWAEDGRFKVLATGSMLGIDYKRPSSFPVGYVQHFEMFSLSLEEFIYAAEISDEVYGFLHDLFEKKKKVPDAINDRLLDLTRQYMVVGGMPEAVRTYFERNSLAEADNIQRQILQDYRYDIAHYAAPDIKIKAENCYFSVSRQLSEDNHKFLYSNVERGGTARKYESSLEWLENADLIRKCFNLKSVEVPLISMAERNNFRVYLTDIGLLCAMFPYQIKAMLLEKNKNLAAGVRGGLYEALIADILIKNGTPLYFRKNTQATFEMEFVLEKDGCCVPVEVKSSNSRSRSLDNMLKKEEIQCGYKLVDGNTGVSGKKVTMPLYMAMFL